MIRKVVNFALDIRDRQKISIALAKSAAMMNARTIDLAQPSSWEFSGFSQNGEDGILDVLRGQLIRNNRYFIEIGAADGIQNNSAWLLIAEQYSGLMIEGDARLVERAKRVVTNRSIGADCKHMFVTRESGPAIRDMALHADPDVFSLDIDGNDWFIAQSILGAGLRPKIIVVEYNSSYGPERSITIDYDSAFHFKKAHPTELYFGASIAAWQKLFAGHGYVFVTVERHGVNCFFVDPACFDSEFLANVQGTAFLENQYHLMKFGVGHNAQFEMIRDCKFTDV